MSVEICYAKIRDFVKEKKLRIPEDRLRTYAKFLENKKFYLLTKNEFNKEVAKLLTDELKQFAIETKLANRINLAAMESAARAVTTPNERMGLLERVRAAIEGGALAPGEKSNQDVRHFADTNASDLFGVWKALIGPLRELAADGRLNYDTYRALHYIENKLDFPKDLPEDAIKIAKAVHAFEDYQFEQKRQYNPRLRRTENYMVNQTHAREKVAAVSEDEWVSAAMETYGEKSFPDAEDKESIFRDIYKRIVEGRYGTINDQEPGDIMSKMARNRVLIASSPEAQFKYNEKFGYGTIEETVSASILRTARDLAVIQKFSSKPEDWFNYLMKRAEEVATPEERIELQRSRTKLYDALLEATGKLDTPAYGAGKVAEGLRIWEGMVKLGRAWVSSWMDIATAAGTMTSTNGKGIFSNATELAVEYAKYFAPFGRGAAEEALEDGWIFHRSFMTSLMQEMGSTTFNPKGKLQRLASAVHKFTLMDRHVVAAKAAMAVVLGRHLARAADTAFANLSPFWKQGLKRYGIGELEWDTLRLAKKDWSGLFEGRRVELLTSDSVKAIPDEAIEIYLRKSGQWGELLPPSQALIKKTRGDLNRLLGLMINEHADLGSTSATTRQRAFMYRGEDANSGKGIALRLVWQFKSAALTQADVYRRVYRSGATPRGNFAATAQMAILATFLYAAGRSFKDLLDGKTPESPMSVQYALDAFANSGAGGILASSILEEHGAAGMAGSLLGPVIGDLAKLGDIAKDTVTAERVRDIPLGRASRLATSLIPGQNLLFTKGLLRFYVLNGVHEFFDTGYLGNVERQVRQRHGLLEERQRYFMWRPTESPRID